MKKFLEKFPWLQRAGCGVLICALLLSICLPLMGMRSAEPDNPILHFVQLIRTFKKFP